jgi:hypothetical protein
VVVPLIVTLDPDRSGPPPARLIVPDILILLEPLSVVAVSVVAATPFCGVVSWIAEDSTRVVSFLPTVSRAGFCRVVSCAKPLQLNKRKKKKRKNELNKAATRVRADVQIVINSQLFFDE